MKEFPLNLSKFKKVAEDENTSTLKHKDGHEITVAHNKIKPELKAKLEKLPLTTPKTEQPNIPGQYVLKSSQNPPKKVPQPQQKQVPQMSQEEMQALKVLDPYGQKLQQLATLKQQHRAETAPIAAEAAGEEKEAKGAGEAEKKMAEFARMTEQAVLPPAPLQAPMQAAAPATPQAPTAVSTAQAQPQAAIPGAIVQGAPTQAPAQAAAPATPQAPTTPTATVAQPAEGVKVPETGQLQPIQQPAQPVQPSAEDVQKDINILQSVERDSQKYMHALETAEIDPFRVIKQMTTGDKIMTFLGMMLGGMGGGLTGQGNQAGAFFDKMIDADIEAQKTNIGKMNTLLEHNEKRYHNRQEAIKMTKAMYLDSLNFGLKKLEHQTNSAQKKAELAALANNFAAKSQALKNEMAIQRLAQKGGTIDPAVLIPHLVPKEKQDAIRKEVENAKSIKHLITATNELYDRATEELSGLSLSRFGLSSLTTEPRFAANLMEFISKTTGKVPTDSEMKHLMSFHPSSSDIRLGDTSRIEQKRKDFINYIMAHYGGPEARAYNIPLEKFESTQPNTEFQLREMLKNNEGKTITLPNGQKAKVKDGKVIPIETPKTKKR